MTHFAAYGGGVSETIVNPLVLLVTLVAGLLILVLPYKKAIIPLLTFGILIPINQIVVVGSLHFPMLRVLALFGFLRIFWAKFSGKDKLFSGGVNGIDKALIVLCVFTAVDGILLWQAWGEVVYQLGNLFTAFGVYFLLRHLIRDEDDVKRFLKVLAGVMAVIAVFMMYESITGRNLFYAILGGARAATLSTATVRADAFRAQGCFGHPIIAGTFGGFMTPLFLGWWKLDRQHRTLAVVGAISAAVIPFAVGSSTALFALLAGLGALCVWPLRHKLRTIRWGILAVIVGLDVVMKAPVWQLIARVHLSDGSSSWHRYELVNQCIIHFWEWAAIGTKNYPSWGWEMGDLANQYVGTADRSGLMPLIALILILVFGFKYIGRARQSYEGEKHQEFFAWAVGCSLFANLVGFFGISYWDQVIVPWYGVLAIIWAVSLSAHTQMAESGSKIVATPENSALLSSRRAPQIYSRPLKPSSTLDSTSRWLPNALVRLPNRHR